MFFRLLAEESGAGGGPSQYVAYILIAIILILMVVFFVVSSRKNKKKQKEYEDELAAISEGTKVRTIGGICGIVREVCSDNTLIIETGSEFTGKSFIKMDRMSIMDTDLKVDATVTATTDDTTTPPNVQ